MRAQRVWKVNGAASIGQLQSRLDDLNKRLGQLESQHPANWRLEELRSSALSLSREIDDNPLRRGDGGLERALAEVELRAIRATRKEPTFLDAIAMLSMEQNHDQAPDASPSRARGGRRGVHAGPVRDGSIHHRAPLRAVRDFA
ncbi:hypothetical protein ACVW0J_008603 [Bradyrhizobium sp. i1.7.7]